jgi:hypothetical protein
MRVFAAAEVKEAQDELDSLRGGTRKDFENPTAPLAEMEFHWDRFVTLLAEARAGYFSGEILGSIAPLLRAAEIARLNRWRASDIQQNQKRRDNPA